MKMEKPASTNDSANPQSDDLTAEEVKACNIEAMMNGEECRLASNLFKFHLSGLNDERR